MGPGVIVSSTGDSSPLVGILGRLLYGSGGVMLIVIYSVTGCVDGSASFVRTQGISACEMLS